MKLKAKRVRLEDMCGRVESIDPESRRWEYVAEFGRDCVVLYYKMGLLRHSENAVFYDGNLYKPHLKQVKIFPVGGEYHELFYIDQVCEEVPK